MSDLLARIAEALASLQAEIDEEAALVLWKQGVVRVTWGAYRWESAWNEARAGATKRLYNLKERRHVLNLLKNYPDRQFFGQTRIVGLSKNGKRIKTYRGKGKVRIADFSEVSGPPGKLVAELGDIKSETEIKNSVRKLKTGELVDDGFRDSATIAKQHKKELEVLKDARALKAKIVLEVENPLTGQKLQFEVSPAKMTRSRVVPYNFVHSSRLPLPSESVYLPKGAAKTPRSAENVKGRAAGKARSPQRFTRTTYYSNGVTETLIETWEPRRARNVAGKARGKPPKAAPTKPTTYAGAPPSRGEPGPTPREGGGSGGTRATGRVTRGASKAARGIVRHGAGPASTALDAYLRAREQEAAVRGSLSTVTEAGGNDLEARKRQALEDPAVRRALARDPFGDWVYEIRTVRRAGEAEGTNVRYKGIDIVGVSVVRGAPHEDRLIQDGRPPEARLWVKRERVHERSRGEELVARDLPLSVIDSSHGRPRGAERTRIIRDYLDYARRYSVRRHRYDEAVAEYGHELHAVGEAGSLSRREQDVCRAMHHKRELSRSRGTLERGEIDPRPPQWEWEALEQYLQRRRSR